MDQVLWNVHQLHQSYPRATPDVNDSQDCHFVECWILEAKKKKKVTKQTQN